jgi:sulfide:quinone oxidoreductase
MAETSGHRIVIIGGGTAGITVAARLRRKGENDVVVIEPSDTHLYQPLWTLVGSGHATAEETKRPEADVMPKGVQWIRDRVASVDPDERIVETEGGTRIGYEVLVLAPGLELHWDGVAGLADAVGKNGVVSNYRWDLAERTWEEVRALSSGRALFTQPNGPIKCGGAPQKAAYMSCDHWQRVGVLDRIEPVFALPGDSLFGVPEFREVLEQVVDRYGVDVWFGHELTEIRPEAKQAVFSTADGPRTVGYDFLHAVPPQRAPAFVRESSLAVAGDERGWAEVDAATLQHRRYDDVFALGDVAGIPASKTGAAVRKQAPVLVENVLARLDKRPPTANYDGYSSCPIVTGEGKMLLAEFDYTMTHHKTIPLIDTVKERRDMWYLKRYGLPALYWNLMLKGRA